MSVTPTYPVAHPTWYDTIRLMFTKTDIAHMGSQELDLTSYDQVQAASGNIYGQVAAHNMPPGNPWTPDMVQTFLNWLSDGCPKGTPTSDQVYAMAALSAKRTAAARIRKDVNSLSATERDTLKKAFEGILAKDVSDPNSYFAQAGIHWLPERYCQHHVPSYNPWHRAYLLGFENALRSVPGCENVTLPYWDITTPFPDLLKSPPYDSYTLPQDVGGGFGKGYVTERFSYPDIAANLLQYDVTADVNRALTKTDWEDFHGYWSGAPYNTIIAAHDSGHGSIGPTMANQAVASFDPVFWFFHSNWDRLWWEWQKKVQGTDLNGLLSTINKTTDLLSYQIFTLAPLQALTPFTAGPLGLNTVKTIDSIALGVDYAPPAAPPKPVAFALKTSRAVSVDRKVSLDAQHAMVSVTGINRIKIPGSFAVHLMKDGKTIASRFMFQPDDVDQCETCVKNAMAHFDFDLPLAEVTGGKLSVEVEPVNKTFVGARFPSRLMGSPMIDVHIPLQTD
ncbi:MAG: tyrosinase family protein [Bradyrhizobium sp.]|nr:tyrosinase family protein [Bradyrhizobium sp.]